MQARGDLTRHDPLGGEAPRGGTIPPMRSSVSFMNLPGEETRLLSAVARHGLSTCQAAPSPAADPCLNKTLHPAPDPNHPIRSSCFHTGWTQGGHSRGAATVRCDTFCEQSVSRANSCSPPKPEIPCLFVAISFLRYFASISPRDLHECFGGGEGAGSARASALAPRCEGSMAGLTAPFRKRQDGERAHPLSAVDKNALDISGGGWPSVE